MHPQCPPPRGFRPITELSRGKFLRSRPPFIRRRKPKGRKAQGIRYERKVLEFLEASSPLPLYPGPWIEFWDKERGKWTKRWCQPDGLLLDPWEGRAIVVEVKYQHTSDAWWQLRKLYLPVLEMMLPEYEFFPLEICKWYDPAVSFPEEVAMTPVPWQSQGFGSSSPFGVHIWKP